MPPTVAVAIELTDEERAQLEAWARRRTSAQALAQRSRIVLLAADGLKNTEIAERLGIRASMAAKWRNRFAEHRLDGLTDEPRPGQPRTITDEQVEEVIVKTLETTPQGRDALVDALDGRARSGSTQTAVPRIWKAFGLQPHRQDTWKLSKDPQFIEKVRDVVGLYLNPPERAVVLCVDEKSQIQALDRTAPILPMLPGVPERATHDYKRARHLEPVRRAGPHHRQGHRRAAQPPPRDRVQAVPADASTARSRPSSTSMSCSTTAARTRRRRSSDGWLAHPRFVLHFTPTSSSWLNLVERWFAELTTKLLRRGTHRSVRDLNADIRAWIETWNDDPKPLRLDQDRRPDPRIDRPLLHRINESRH